MKYQIKKIVKWVGALVAVALASVTLVSGGEASAAGFGLTLSPMNQKLIIDPGDSHDASFKISNPAASTDDTFYEISVEPFYVDEKGSVVYESYMESGKIVDWIKFNAPTKGKLVPNETKEIVFTIDVPKSAPAGGQYAAIFITANNKPEDNNDQTGSSSQQGASIKETKRFAHLVYTEITGNTIKQGEIRDLSVPSFLLSGEVKASAKIKNTGNVHGTATCTLQVFPLFSGEEVYTNEEKPSIFTVMPEREKIVELAWDKTPSIGIFNVVFTVEFEGAKEQISKMVIKCPLWLLFLIVFAIVALIIWITLQAKNRRKKANN